MTKIRKLLYDFLRGHFEAPELRRFVTYLPSGGKLEHQLPGEIASKDDVVDTTVRLLVQHRAYRLDVFWSSLQKERPTLAEKIQTLRQMVRVLDREPKVTALVPVPTKTRVVASPTLLEGLDRIDAYIRQARKDVDMRGLVEPVGHALKEHLAVETTKWISKGLTGRQQPAAKFARMGYRQYAKSEKINAARQRLQAALKVVDGVEALLLACSGEIDARHLARWLKKLETTRGLKRPETIYSHLGALAETIRRAATCPA